MTHPKEALFESGKSLPIIPTCEHFAGSEKLILKGFEMQKKLGPVFDITCDCEDGAETGKEVEHANMIVRVVNSDENPYAMAGTRIHDHSHPDWRQDVDILVPGAGEKLAYITLPKSTCYEDAKTQIEYIQKVAKEAGISREIPIHVLIETHGALQDVEKIEHKREDIGLLRVRTIGLKNVTPKEVSNPKGEDGKYLPNVVLDLDYTVVIPKKKTQK